MYWLAWMRYSPGVASLPSGVLVHLEALGEGGVVGGEGLDDRRSARQLHEPFPQHPASPRLTGEPREEMKKVKAELSELKKEADRLLRNLTEANREFIDERLVEIKRRRRELEARMEGLQGAAAQEIDTEAAVDAAMAHLGRFREVLEQGTFLERKEFLRAFVIRIDLDPEAKRGTLHIHNYGVTAHVKAIFFEPSSRGPDPRVSATRRRR